MPRSSAAKTKPESKDSRISMRVDPARKEVIARAARLRHTSISNFMIENAYLAASDILADETQIRMTPEQYDEFCRVLDNPPAENIAKLRALLNSKTILDE